MPVRVRSEPVPMKFLTHVSLRPNDGGESIVIEHEFEADSWHKAWEHVMGLGRQFDATVTSHRIMPINTETGEVIYNGGVQTPTVVVPKALPAPEPEPLKLDWFGKVVVPKCEPKPWPTELTVNLDGAQVA